MAYFPMFVEIVGRECLVVGGGSVAYRKTQVLLDYQAYVHIVAKDICQDLQDLASSRNEITISKRDFSSDDLEDMLLVIAATNDAMTNKYIAAQCMQHRVPVNVVDNKVLSTFILPSYVKEDNLVAAFSSGGKSPALTQLLKAKEKDILTPFLGQLNEALGSLRPEIKGLYETEEERKAAYNRIIEEAIRTGNIPDKGNLREFLK